MQDVQIKCGVQFHFVCSLISIHHAAASGGGLVIKTWIKSQDIRVLNLVFQIIMRLLELIGFHNFLGVFLEWSE